MRLSHFSRLSEIPDVAFYSLQKGSAAAQTGLELIDFTAELNDFSDTAALVGALDLVIAEQEVQRQQRGQQGGDPQNSRSEDPQD